MKNVLLAGVTFAALVTSTLAISAQTMNAHPCGMAQPPHKLTFVEFKADADKLWDRLDVNRDGKLDGADRDARLLEPFVQWDTNHDGMVSKHEFLERFHTRETEWKMHDHNDLDDHDRGHDDLPSFDGFGGHDAAMGSGHGAMGGRGHPHGQMMAAAIIGPAVRDAAKDGVVNRVAFNTAIKARFDTIDTNHDGKLSHEEMRAARLEHGHDHGDMPPHPAGQ